MLEYHKTILEKVSFNAHLFEKELMKSSDYLSKSEQDMLYKWALARYGSKYSDILERYSSLILN